MKKIFPNTLRLEIENSKTNLNIDKKLSNLDNIKKKDEIELFNEFYKYQHDQELNSIQLEIIEDIIKDVKGEVK